MAEFFPSIFNYEGNPYSEAEENKQKQRDVLFAPSQELEEEKSKQRESFSNMFTSEIGDKSSRVPLTMGLLSAGAQLLMDSNYVSSEPRGMGYLGRALVAGMGGYAKGQQSLRQAQLDERTARRQDESDENARITFANQQELHKQNMLSTAEELKNRKYQNKIAELQQKTYEQFEQKVANARKANFITAEQEVYLMGFKDDPITGMNVLMKAVGNNANKLTGVTSENVEGTNWTAFYQQNQDGTKTFLKLEKKPNTLKAADLVKGSELNARFNVDGYLDNEYYSRNIKTGEFTPIDPQKFNKATSLRKEAETVMKGYKTLADQFTIIKDNVTKESAPGDVALAFAFMKMLDPNSVVRESEFAQVGASMGLLQRVQQALTKAKKGERFSAPLRQELLRISESIAKLKNAEASTRVANFKEIAKINKIQDQVFITNPFDVSGINDQPPPGLTPDEALGFNTPTKGEFADTFAKRSGYYGTDELGPWKQMVKELNLVNPDGSPMTGPRFNPENPVKYPVSTDLYRQRVLQASGEGENFGKKFRLKK